MRKAFIFLQVALLLFFSVAATAFGMAKIYRNEAATLVEGWIWEEDDGPPAWAWEQVERYLWLASRLAPFDAQVKSDLGQFYENRLLAAQAEAVPDPLSDPHSRAAPAADIRTDSDTALELYRQALALRPARARDWANVALLKVTRQDFDAEFALAASSTLTLGPWESSVQASIVAGSLAEWDQLPAPLQTEIEHALQRGLSNGSRLMQFVARRFGLFETTSATQPEQAVAGKPSAGR